MQKLHSEVLAIAKTAGSIALKNQQEIILDAQSVKVKKDDDEYESLVSRVDKELNQLLTNSLLKLNLEAGVIAEEGYDTSDKPYQWAIDPIDGTSSYVNGFDHFGICIALWHKSTPVYGLMYFPAREGEYIYAIKDAGAFYFDKKSEKGLKKSDEHFKYLSYAFPTGDIDLKLNYQKNLVEAGFKLYSFKACSFETKSMFTSKMAGSVMLNHGLWDVSPSIVIARELGMRVKILNDSNSTPDGSKKYDVVISVDKEFENIVRCLG